MGLLDNLVNQEPKRTCRVATVAATLEEGDREIFLHAISDSNFPIKRLEKELRARGIDISDTSIDRHRTKRCSC